MEISDITAEGYRLLMAAPELLQELLASHDYHVAREMTYFKALEEAQALLAAGDGTESVLQAIEEAWSEAMGKLDLEGQAQASGDHSHTSIQQEVSDGRT